MALTATQLKELERILAQRHETLVAETQEDVERSREETYGELAGPVADTGDEAVADLIADLDAAEISRDVRELRALEDARARIAGGRFGRCADCGLDIDFARLRAYPTAERCLACQSVHEKTYAHPAEHRL